MQQPVVADDDVATWPVLIGLSNPIRNRSAEITHVEPFGAVRAGQAIGAVVENHDNESSTSRQAQNRAGSLYSAVVTRIPWGIVGPDPRAFANALLTRGVATGGFEFTRRTTLSRTA